MIRMIKGNHKISDVRVTYRLIHTQTYTHRQRSKNSAEKTERGLRGWLLWFCQVVRGRMGLACEADGCEGPFTCHFCL